MTWKIEWDESVKKDLKRLDPNIRLRIRAFLHERVAPLEDPTQLAKPLRGPLYTLWRFRVAKDYRVICDIQQSKVVVLIVRVGHRSEVYE